MPKSETTISNTFGKYLTANQIPNWRASVLRGQFRKSAKHKWYHIITGTAGLSDRQFLIDDMSGQTVYLEVKKPGETMSADQKDFESMCVARNIPYFCCDNIMDVQEILELYGMCKLTVKQWLDGEKIK